MRDAIRRDGFFFIEFFHDHAASFIFGRKIIPIDSLFKHQHILDIAVVFGVHLLLGEVGMTDHLDRVPGRVILPPEDIVVYLCHIWKTENPAVELGCPEVPLIDFFHPVFRRNIPDNLHIFFIEGSGGDARADRNHLLYDAVKETVDVLFLRDIIDHKADFIRLGISHHNARDLRAEFFCGIDHTFREHIVKGAVKFPAERMPGPHIKPDDLGDPKRQKDFWHRLIHFHSVAKRVFLFFHSFVSPAVLYEPSAVSVLMIIFPEQRGNQPIV